MRSPAARSRQLSRGLAAALLVVVVAACQDPLGSPSAQRSVPETADAHGAFTMSTGIYRIPYSNGTALGVSRDHHIHTPQDRIDMVAGQGTPVVASATGVIRAIIDFHGNSPNAGDGVDINGVAQNDALEHSCGNNLPANTVVGQCSDYNNYVWVEHANGEFTKYTHLGTGTVTLPAPNGFGWSVGDTVQAGQTLGLESDIGQATAADGVSPAFHLHYEVAVSNDGNPLFWSALGGFIQNGVNVVPTVCDIANNLYVTNGNYVAAACLNNAAPTADAGGPYEVNEGGAILLDGSASNDPDGLPLTFVWTPTANFPNANLATPVFRGGDDGVTNITLWVFDQVESLSANASTSVTVLNVDPVLTIDPDQVTVIDEGGTLSVQANFSDAGWLDTHNATIDWGVPAGHPGLEVAPASVQVLDAGGPGVALTGRITGTYRYGDNDAGAGFTITITVTDDDGGEATAEFAVTVNNKLPGTGINPADAQLINGVPTIIANAGEALDFESSTQDAGSDDLTLAWDWGDGSTDSRISLVNPPDADPSPSPTVQARDELDQRVHAFAEACMYTVGFTATDDDGGSRLATLDVLITGTSDRVRGSGYWSAEYRLLKSADYTPEQLACFVAIVSHVSAVFGESVPLANLIDAAAVLHAGAASSSDDARLDVALLEAWLNFATGAFSLDQVIGGNGNVPEMTYHNLMKAAETVRNDPGRTAEQLQEMRARLNTLNNGA